MQVVSTGTRLYAGQSGVRIPERTRNFAPTHSVQTGLETDPDCYSIGVGDSFHGDKAGGREANHSYLSNAEVKNERKSNSTAPVFLHSLDRGLF